MDAWGGKLPHRLIVENVNPAGAAQIVYAIGGEKGSWLRRQGQISDRVLRVDLSPGIQVQYSFLPDGTLWGIYSRGPNKSYVYLRPIPETPARSTETVQDGQSEIILIPVTSHLSATEGKTFQLKSTVYRSRLPGARPLIIFNHGSADGVSPAMSFDFHDTLLFFRALGFTVVMPMRKGRGGSEGPYLESEDQSSEQQLESGLEDVAAVKAYFSRQPGVDASRVIIAGQSRGGLLAMAFAARYPRDVVGVINFSGGWYGERVLSDFNFSEFARDGKSTGIPVLWLYADHDPYYSLSYAARLYESFHAAGGHGTFVELHVPEGFFGHFAFTRPDYWSKVVQAYLKSRTTSSPAASR
jgi:dienelactone hydrolase